MGAEDTSPRTTNTTQGSYVGYDVQLYSTYVNQCYCCRICLLTRIYMACMSVMVQPASISL